MDLTFKLVDEIPEKVCFKCNRLLPLEEFYAHYAMADGHLNKCKRCTRGDVGRNRHDNIDRYREYDRTRPYRANSETQRKYREKYPKKRKAHHLINNQIRDGKRVKEPCEVCGTDVRVQAHHDDYDKPDEVRWLCAIHHNEWHRENGEGRNAF